MLDTSQLSRDIYSLYLTTQQADAVVHACDVIARVRIGQIEEPFHFLYDYRGKFVHIDRFKLDYVKELILPYIDLSPNASWGVGKFPQADILFDIKEVMRRPLALERKMDETDSWSVDLDRPHHWYGDLPLPSFYKTTDSSFFFGVSKKLVWNLVLTQSHLIELAMACLHSSMLSIGIMEPLYRNLLNEKGETPAIPIATKDFIDLLVERHTRRRLAASEKKEVEFPRWYNDVLPVFDAVKNSDSFYWPLEQREYSVDRTDRLVRPKLRKNVTPYIEKRLP